MNSEGLNLSPLDLGWLAGLLEGEGSFTWRSGRTPKVGITMTDLDVLERVQHLLGGHIWEATPKEAHHKKAWIWYVHGSPAVAVMHLVAPHMGTRRSQRIASVLATYEARQATLADRQRERSERGRQAGLAYLAGEGTLRSVGARFGVSHVTVKNFADDLRVCAQQHKTRLQGQQAPARQGGTHRTPA